MTCGKTLRTKQRRHTEARASPRQQQQNIPYIHPIVRSVRPTISLCATTLLSFHFDSPFCFSCSMNQWQCLVSCQLVFCYYPHSLRASAIDLSRLLLSLQKSTSWMLVTFWLSGSTRLQHVPAHCGALRTTMCRKRTALTLEEILWIVEKADKRKEETNVYKGKNMLTYGEHIWVFQESGLAFPMHHFSKNDGRGPLWGFCSSDHLAIALCWCPERRWSLCLHPSALPRHRAPEMAESRNRMHVILCLDLTYIQKGRKSL